MKKGYLMEALKIVALCMLAAVCYGIIHDQFTVRICLEYFTVGHPKIIETDSPVILAFAWGIVATWWVGLILGVPLAITCRAGGRPQRNAFSIIKPMLILLGVMAGVSVIAGITGYFLGKNGNVWLLEPMYSRVPKSKHPAFLANLWTHSAGYLVGVVGGIVLMVVTWRSRKVALGVAND